MALNITVIREQSKVFITMIDIKFKTTEDYFFFLPKHDT